MKVFLAILVIAICFTACKEKDSNEIKKKYVVYFTEADKQLSKLSNSEKSSRDSFLNQFHKSEMFKKAVKGEVNTRVLLVMNVLSEAIAHTLEDTSYTINATSDAQLSIEERSFFVNAMTLSFGGGFGTELVKIFDNHIAAYGLYGKRGSVRYDSSGKASERMPRSYDVTPLALMLMPKDKTILDALLEAKKADINHWDSVTSCNYSYVRPYLTCLPAYIDYLRSVYPESRSIALYDSFKPH